MRSTDAMAVISIMHNYFSKYPTDKPNISLSPGPTYFEKGKNITLPKCHVTSFPPAVITWSRVRGELAYSRTLTLLSVLELPRFTSNPPAQLNVRQEQNISVSCQAAGDPKPKIMWVRENSQLPVGRSQVSPEGTLQIRNIKDEDSGIYICIAISAQLFKRSLMQLTVGKEWFASVTFHWVVIFFSAH